MIEAIRDATAELQGIRQESYRRTLLLDALVQVHTRILDEFREDRKVNQERLRKMAMESAARGYGGGYEAGGSFAPGESSTPVVERPRGSVGAIRTPSRGNLFAPGASESPEGSPRIASSPRGHQRDISVEGGPVGEAEASGDSDVRVMSIEKMEGTEVKQEKGKQRGN